MVDTTKSNTFTDSFTTNDYSCIFFLNSNLLSGMSLKASYEFLFVGKDESSFLENYSYDLFQDHGEKSGQIFVNLEVQNNPVDAEEIGSVIFETMQKMFFEHIGDDPYERFESALKAVNGVLSEFRAQKLSSYIGNLNVIVSAIVGDQLFLSQCGDAEAYLIRKRYVSVVSEGLSDDVAEGETFGNIASGQIEAGDFVMFSSTRLLRYISKTDLAQCVNKKDIVESLDDVKDIISTEILGRVSLTGLLFSNVTKAEEAEFEKETDTANRGMMEANDSRVATQKETFTGNFVAVAKKYGNRAKSTSLNVSKVSQWFLNFYRSLFSKGFGKDKILALLILVIVALTAGIFIASGQQTQKDEIEKLDQVLISVQDRISEAETKGNYDKDVAKEILNAAYLDAKTVLDSGTYREKATILLVKIEEARDKLDNVQRIENPVVLADLSAKRSDVSALGFALVDDKVFIYEYNALYELVLDQIQDPLTIDDEETVIGATGFDDRNSVVFLTKSGKLIEYKDGTMSFMDTDDGSFKQGVSIADWSNRIYMLDSVSNQIWRYTYKGTKDMFGAAEEYVVDGTDLSKSEDLAIDGSVYALENTGDILKFYAGTKQDMFINNAPSSAFKTPTEIYTTEKLDQVFVLDGAESRVLVFLKDTKTGNLVYSAQYYVDGVGELRDIYVDGATKTMYLLTASKVLKVAL